MKPTDLQIGYYALAKPSMMLIKIAAVHHKKVGYHAVTHKLNWVRMGLLEPILLTLEILERNRFEQNVDNEDRYCFEDTTIDFKHDAKYLFSASVNGSEGMLYLCANYVHELRHSLQLVGINKEIIL